MASNNYFITHGMVKFYIDDFLSKRKINHRYTSFDICYSYFYKNRGKAIAYNLELSCLYLWAFLSSWGMLRGSQLLQKSPVALVPVIKHISNASQDLWDIDVDSYTDDNIKNIVGEYNKLRNKIKKKLKFEPSTTLLTKIMLGVYGNIPAFDNFFTDTLKKLYPNCGFTTVNEKTLECIRDFYNNNCASFCRKVKVLNFAGEETDIYYPKVKLVDMFGFSMGLHQSEKDKAKNNTTKP